MRPISFISRSAGSANEGSLEIRVLGQRYRLTCANNEQLILEAQRSSDTIPTFDEASGIHEEESHAKTPGRKGYESEGIADRDWRW